MNNVLVGIDIGGTKCAVSIGKTTETAIDVLAKEQFPTPASPTLAIQTLITTLDHLLDTLDLSASLCAIGISCGSPLSSKKGLILSPPNLPHWDNIDIVGPFKEKYHVPVGLQNDANACALAEWKWGAGRGCSNMIFLTFGTGMGAGLILDGKLYTGINDMAGEVGHIRMEEDGPIGYGKRGSFEGFCSGGGIARLARHLAEQAIKEGNPPEFCTSLDDLGTITAKSVGLSAQKGDLLARRVYDIVGHQLGKGLALLIDLLNPERIVIGSIYGRQLELLEPIVKVEIEKEALPISRKACEIVPAELGESVGDLASLSVAINTVE
ncbi:glucokinase [Pullulanibacillus pueri]|uniref:N-acylmannosamine kinase n=1 Tax=Pullulanibacillus pueri TaxID=1437324 RepID=A0A8J2ZX72_9BACL|nr:ROK family protein [Pullulanibacillus pueri]MBM7682908.1 glucokinase [Pullulanibacillus pueri]GGH84818.1 N-acylmannosamine kinase [Pullulanibacillus pueri]